MIPDSQVKFVEAGKLSILSPPCAGIKQAYDLIPAPPKQNSISSFCILVATINSTESSLLVTAQNLIELAVCDCRRIKSSVFVPSILERDENRASARVIKKLFERELREFHREFSQESSRILAVSNPCLRQMLL